jgi:hypothetical protein
MALATKVGTDRASRYRRVMEGLFIRSERGTVVPMRFSQSQEVMWAQVAPKLNRREKLWFIVLKGRQVYASTFFQALTFVRTLEQPGTNSLVVAHDLFTSHDLFEKSKTFHEYLPLPKLKSARMNELVFPFPGGTSRYRVISAGTVAKGRGTTQTCMHLSEIPSWPHPDIATGLFQAMPDLPDTILVEESTAKGVSGPGRLFYDEWNAATRGESDLQTIFIPWYVMSKYRRQPGLPADDWDEEERLLAATFGVDGEQLAWRRYAIKTKCQGLLDNFHQEYPSSPEEAFIFSGQPAFDRLSLFKQRANIQAPLWRGTFIDGKLYPTAQGEVRIWKHPEGGGEYAIGADTAEGLTGGDYAAAEVLDMRTMEQVASVHGTIQPYEFSVLLNHLGHYYNRAALCIEVYPHGHRVQDHLIREFYYPNLHRWRGKPDRVRITPAKLYGWETNVWSRPLLIGAGQRSLNHNLVTLHEEGLLDELLQFSKSDEGKYEAEVGHDDRVLALLLALRTREENYVERHHGPALSEAPLPTSIRVVEARDVDGDGRRRISKLLRQRAQEAVRSWMSY